jgi:energy-coupling factor transporter ATP-binding protein EcfA2
MLLSFSVSNFRSFRDEQTFSLVASNRQPDHQEHLIPIPDDENKALPVAAIYGANGAGKSNLVRALEFLVNLVKEGAAPKQSTGRVPFLLDKQGLNQPSSLSIQFVEAGMAFAMGVTLDQTVIRQEWLSVVRNGKEITVYERITDDGGKVRVEVGPVLLEDSWGNHSKVVALSRVGVLPNLLFLHGISQSLTEDDQGPVIAAALRWLTTRPVIVSPTSVYSGLVGLIAGNGDFAGFAGDFLRRVATGVNALRVESSELGDNAVEAMPGNIRARIAEMGEGEVIGFGSSGDASHQIVVEKGAGAKVFLRTVKAEHLTKEGDLVRLPLSEESDGTRRLTQLLPALHSINQGPRVYVIDEIDRSLHPLLSKGFVRAFLDACVSNGSQLVFTTHDTTFLDLDLLRRDEIWFANKRMPEAFTELYSLSDYKVRTDLKVDKAYLQGRFEAVPPIETELPGWVTEIMRQLRGEPTQEPLREEANA